MTSLAGPLTLARRSVVLVAFPFSDLSAQKLRPALVLADAGRGDWLLCQITSQPFGDAQAMELIDGDFQAGSLQRVSYARPLKLFTAHESLLRGVAGAVTGAAHRRVVAALVGLLGDDAASS